MVPLPARLDLRALEVQPGVEERVVHPGDGGALLSAVEPGQVVVALLGHVHSQLVQVVDIVSVRRYLVWKVKMKKI